jgi:hypothetical protein
VQSSATGTVHFRKDLPFNGVKVFSATMINDREQLGDKVTEWLAAHSGCRITEICVTQSSDRAYHCLAMTVFYNEG